MVRPTLLASSLSLPLVAAAFLVGGSPAAQKHLLPANEPDPRGLVTDQPVVALAQHEHRLFLGGLSYVGANGGSFAVTNTELGCPNTDLDLFFNPVHEILADGDGGWFVSGDSHISGPSERPTVVHVRADGTVDRSLPVPDGGTVLSMAVDGETLYIGGHFDMIGDEDREGLAAIDLVTKELLPWDPAVAASFSSYDIQTLVVMDGVVYIGGNFQDDWIGGEIWSHLAAVDGVTGDAVGTDFAIGGSVSDLLARDGLLTLGGWFSSIGGLPRYGLGVIDISTGQPTPFAPELDGGAHSLWQEGDVLFVGGLFEEVDGLPRENLAALDLLTEQVLPLSLDFEGTRGTNLALHDLCVASGVLYMAGHFLSIDGQDRYLFAAADATTGALRDWNPRAMGLYSPEGFAVAVQGDEAAIGGKFHMLDAVPRPGVASIDLRTGELEDWCPDLNGGAATVFAFRAGQIYIGGDFAIEEPVSRADLIRVDAETGDIDPTFDAGLDPVGSGNVRELVLNGDLLHVGGYFRRPGFGYRGLATLEVASGVHVPGWDTDVLGSLKAMAVPPNGQHLYLGGNINDIGSTAGGWEERHDLAVVDAHTGAVLPWAPELDNDVNALLGVPGGLMAGGKFRHVAYEVQRGCGAIFDYPGHALRAWNPDVSSGPSVSIETLGLHDGAVYLGGRFDRIADVWSPFLGAMDLSSAEVLDWRPNMGGEVHQLVVGPRHVIVAGDFNYVGDLSLHNLSFFDLYALRSSVDSISVAAGGTQPMDITPGTKFAGSLYWLLGSLSGTDPGHWLEGFHVPLVRDDYYDFTWGSPGYPPLVGGVGFLDEHGEAAASLVIPPGTDPALAGITVHHAAVVVDLSRKKLVSVTNALPLLLEE